MSNVAHLHSMERELGEALVEGLRTPVLRAAKAADAAESNRDGDPVERRVEMHRRDISSHEKAINRLQKEQAIREAELQSDLASLAQEIEERKAELQREADRREAEIITQIEANRNQRTDEIKMRSRLLAASHAAVDSLHHSIEPVLGFGGLAAAE